MIGFGIVLGLVSAKKIIYAFFEEDHKTMYYSLATFIYCCLVVNMEVAR